jgi:hypothetical protein
MPSSATFSSGAASRRRNVLQAGPQPHRAHPGRADDDVLFAQFVRHPYLAGGRILDRKRQNGALGRFIHAILQIGAPAILV